MSEIGAEQRQELALNAINRAFGTEAGEDNVNLFVEHHLEELSQEYWVEHLGAGVPEPKAVVGLLQLRSSWGQSDIEYFDFTLPDQVTDYVVSVHFNDASAIDGITMES